MLLKYRVRELVDGPFMVVDGPFMVVPFMGGPFMVPLWWPIYYLTLIYLQLELLEVVHTTGHLLHLDFKVKRETIGKLLKFTILVIAYRAVRYLKRPKQLMPLQEVYKKNVTKKLWSGDHSFLVGHF